jgi:hypothetical protein
MVVLMLIYMGDYPPLPSSLGETQSGLESRGGSIVNSPFTCCRLTEAPFLAKRYVIPRILLFHYVLPILGVMEFIVRGRGVGYELPNPSEPSRGSTFSDP